MKRLKAAGAFDQAFGNDALKMGFIDALGFGANNKLQLQIADPFLDAARPVGELRRREATPTPATRRPGR